MKRFKSLVAVAVVGAAIVAMSTAANAVTYHFVAAGSSAQWQMAAIGAEQVAINEATANGTGQVVCHWTKSTSSSQGGFVADNRDVRILPEPGNIWIVWLQASGTCPGNTGSGDPAVTDIWLAVSVDSTVGVRTFSIQETGPVSGATVNLGSGTTGGEAGSNKVLSALWPDSSSDGTLNGNVLSDIGTTVGSGPHVSVGMTDIRPEDALFATIRAMAALNTTSWSGLGYVGPTTNIGAPIYTAQSTGTFATPIRFGLSGKKDPINTGITVPPYVTIPIGAAPVIIATNNAGTPAILDITSGVTNPGTTTGGPYLAQLFFSGQGTCDTNDKAFGGTGTATGTPLTIFLREPLSGTMNTTEFNLFRTHGNTKGSQEVGVINPVNTPYNPLNLPCTTHGKRSRSIGTGEVVGSSSPAYGLLGTPNSIGYFFYGFANASKITGTNFNYLTLDTVDPIYGSPSDNPLPNQQLPNCGGSTANANCTSTAEWPATATYPAGYSYPNLRNGKYKAWSVYRWLIAKANIGTDPYGYDAVAVTAQNYVDSAVADFVPYVACPLSDPNCLTHQAVDSLDLYRSHFDPTGITVTAANGAGSNGGTLGLGSGFANAGGGNSLMGGHCTTPTTTFCTNSVQCTASGGTGPCVFPELGGDVGGFIESGTVANTGYGTYTGASDTVTIGTANKVVIHTAHTAGKGYEITHSAGVDFKAGTCWEGQPITINGHANTISVGVPLTTTILYVQTLPTGTNGAAVEWGGTFPVCNTSAVGPGVLNKRQ